MMESFNAIEKNDEGISPLSQLTPLMKRQESGM
jgi:hypothetical protein